MLRTLQIAPIADTNEIFRSMAWDFVAGAIGVGRVNFIVIAGLGLEAVDLLAEDGIGMAGVQADVRCCGLAEVFWVCTATHYAEVFVGAPRVVAGPGDYGPIVTS